MRCLLPLLALVSAFAADAPAPLRVFIRCGPKTHGPGDHDHPAFARDWQPLLTAARMKVSVGDADAKGVQTFPSDEQLAETDVLIIHRQGGGDFKPDEKARVEKFAARGGSFVVIHAGSVAGNDASANFYKDLVGGSWRQKVTKWREGPMELNITDKTHAISTGIADFAMKDEIYYDMDMRPDVHALATALTPKKGEKPDIQTQLWTYEKPGAQRAFVFIPGHTYLNFSRTDVKLLLLRGIAWAGRRANVNEYDTWARVSLSPSFPSDSQPKK